MGEMASHLMALAVMRAEPGRCGAFFLGGVWREHLGRRKREGAKAFSYSGAVVISPIRQALPAPLFAIVDDARAT